MNGNHVILRKERLEHIRERHPEVVDLIKEKYKEILENPNYILKDKQYLDSVWFIKKLENSNINIILKLSLKNKIKHKGLENSIITAYGMSNKQLKRYVNKLEKLLTK